MQKITIAAWAAFVVSIVVLLGARRLRRRWPRLSRTTSWDPELVDWQSTPAPAFLRKLTVSKELAEVIGHGPLSRVDVVKKLWAYIRKNNLQDARERRMINADDKLKLHERLVHQAGRFNMELIIGGSRNGLRTLADSFRRAAAAPADDLDDHDHFDDSEPLLVLPSVFLNIRGPVSDIEARLDELAPPAAEDLYPEIRFWRDCPDLWPYELPAYRDLHGRLPIQRSPGRRRPRRSRQVRVTRAEDWVSRLDLTSREQPPSGELPTGASGSRGR